jgi:uncharacterized protein
VQDKLRALVRLAQIDGAARGIDEQLEGIPRELEDRRAAVRALEALVSGQRTQASQAETLLAEQENEVRSRSDMLARSKAKSAKARNMREAEAAERELESIRRSIRDAEIEKERLQGVLAQTKDVLGEPLRELEEQKSALAQAEAASEQRLADLRKEREKVVTGRERYLVELPKPVYRRYERIRPKLHPVVCEVVDGTCVGCRMRIPPQLYNQIIGATDYHQCPHCQRFLIVKEVLGE